MYNTAPNTIGIEGITPQQEQEFITRTAGMSETKIKLIKVVLSLPKSDREFILDKIRRLAEKNYSEEAREGIRQELIEHVARHRTSH